MFEDILKEKKEGSEKFIICTVTNKIRYIEKGERCSHWSKEGCGKYYVQGNFNCKND
jgi:hypothetical protein